MDVDWRYDSLGVRAYHPRDACCGKGSAGNILPLAGRSAAPRSEVAANGLMRWRVRWKVQYRTRGLRTQFQCQHQRTIVTTEAVDSHTPRRNSGNKNSCDWACSSWLDKYHLDVEQDICSRRARTHNWSVRVWNEVAGLRYEVVCWIPLSILTEEEMPSMVRQSHTLASSSTRLQGQMKCFIPESDTATDVEMAPCVSETPSRTLTSSPEETAQPSAQERPVGRTSSREAIHRVRSVQAPKTPLLSLLAVNHRTWRRKEMKSRRQVQCTTSTPWQQFSKFYVADSTVNEEVTQQSDVDVLSGSTRSWIRTGRGGVYVM